MPWYLIRCVVLVAAVVTPPSAQAADWLHWRGTDRNDHVAEPSGYTDGNWPLVELWKTNVGEGSSSPLVVDDQVYLMGFREGREAIVCLSATTGKQYWRQDYPAPKYGRESTGDKGIYSGPSATPEFDVETAFLYTLGIDGQLACWNAAQQGKPVWSLNLYDQYKIGQRPDVGGKRGGASRRDYGYTTAPLVYDQTLIVEVGDIRRGTVMGFDKRTGRQLWASACRDEAGHSGGAVPMTVEGIPCAAVLTLRRLLIVRLDGKRAGETLAEFEWTTDFGNNIPTPTVAGSSVILTSAYNQYAMCRVDVSQAGAREAWRSELPSGVCSPIVHGGHIYWAWRGIHCVDFETGKLVWQGANVGTAGSAILTSDERLIVLADRGDLRLVESAARSPEKYQELAIRKGLFRRDAWPHVTLSGGRLYCKDRDGNVIVFVLGK